MDRKVESWLAKDVREVGVEIREEKWREPVQPPIVKSGVTPSVCVCV